MAPACRFLQRTLAGYATHANFARRAGGGPGLREQTRSTPWLANSSLREGEDLQVFQHPGQPAAPARRWKKGIALVGGMLPRANQATRTPCSAAHITIGLQCGGSDGYSGISANPALGAAVDLLVRTAGTAILSETPEIYGAEHLLTRRAVRPRWARS